MKLERVLKVNFELFTEKDGIFNLNRISLYVPTILKNFLQQRKFRYTRQIGKSEIKFGCSAIIFYFKELFVNNYFLYKYQLIIKEDYYCL